VSPEERAKYEKMAAADKTRYQNEMKDYVPARGEATKAAKPKKDPNAPKKPLTSFMLFSNEVRSEIKKENPDMSFGELGKKIGELFRALSSEKKQKYEDMAKREKERYKKALMEYESGKKASRDDDGVDDEDDDEDDDEEEDDDE
jgi:HMG (high mobility group) box